MSTAIVRVEQIRSVDAVLDAASLFDHAVDGTATERFLADESHHLLVGYIGRAPAGFVTAVELLHPDKPQPEMFLYELGVHEEYRGRGVATALMQRLIALCRERRCGEMFVLTDDGNAAANATYRRAGAKGVPAGVMFQWDWRSSRSGTP
jgi:ribosomal protein S18 acetylase RimI-like enzyme